MGTTKCEDIQATLLEYLSKELGDGQTMIVSEHLKNCKECHAVAEDMAKTLALLNNTKKRDKETPKHLSAKRHARVVRPFTHPFIDWMDSNHFTVSIAIAIIITCAIFALLLLMKGVEPEPPATGGVEVTILTKESLMQLTNRVHTAPAPIIE